MRGALQTRFYRSFYLAREASTTIIPAIQLRDLLDMTIRSMSSRWILLHLPGLFFHDFDLCEDLQLAVLLCLLCSGIS